MEIGTALTILGLLLALIGAPGLYYIFFKRPYPAQITFVVVDCLGLFESIVKHFPELAISYKDDPVGEGIVLLKGALLNTGSKDITKEMVEDRLCLELPDGFKWLQAKVVSSSPSVQAHIEQETQTLTFDVGLFRCREFIQIECLAEVPMQNDRTASIGARLFKDLSVTHRIADTQKVNPVHLPDLRDAARHNKRLFIPLAAVLILGVSLAVMLFVNGIPSKFHYHIASDSGERIEVTARPQANGDVLIRGVKQRSFKRQIPASDFFQTPNLEPKVVPKRLRKFDPLIAVFYILLPLIVFCGMFLEQRKARRIRGLLGLRDQADDSKKEDPPGEPSTTSG